MSYFSNKRQEYLALDARDRRRFWTDGLLNNALYILMAIFIISRPSSTKTSWDRAPS